MGILADSFLSLPRLQHRGLNCYMYAPKDELKHRLLWREPYTEHEAGSGSAGPLGGCRHPRSLRGKHGLCHSCFHPARTLPMPGKPPDVAKGKKIARACPPWGIAKGTRQPLMWSQAVCLSVARPTDPCQKSSVS